MEKHKNKSKESTFSFEKYRHDLKELLRRYDFVSNYEEFWTFVQKYEKMQRSSTVDHQHLIFFKLKVTSKEAMKYVQTRSLDEEKINKFLDIIKAYLNFKHTERFKKLKALRKNQKDLPVAAYEQEIVREIKNNQVLVVSGDTGCGKSTQVPQFLYKNGFQSIVCTQPRRLACIALSSRLKYETLNQYNNTIGYQIRFEKHKNSDTKILFLTEGLLLRQIQADSGLSNYDVVILDEVHERHLQSDFLLGLLKCLLMKRQDLKVVLMSATINIELFANYFGKDVRVVQVPGRLFPVRVLYKPISVVQEDKKSKLDATPYLQIIQIIDEKYKSEKGDVLIFLSGMAEIMCLVEAVKDYNQKQSSWIVLPLHSSLSLAEQDKVFDYAPEGYRKCIISTNIAETSVTIDGIRFVIDSGKVKEMSYDSVCNIQRLKEFWISKSSAEQRKGRAGRTGPGICYRIYSEKEYAAFDEYTTPEIKRVPLDSVILQMIAMGLPDIRKFPFIEKPNMDDIENCILGLKQQNALTDEEKITEVGKMLSNLPVDITIGKMLIIASVFQQVETAIVLSSVLSVQSPFTNNAFRDLECENLRKEQESDHGDPITLINLYREWLNIKSNKENSRKWCRKRGLEEQRFYEMTKLRQQFKEILIETGLLEISETKPSTSSERMIRNGEIKLLKSMKSDHSQKTGRKKLKIDSFEIEDEKDEVDIKDIEFRLKNDGSSVKQLLRSLSLDSYKDLSIIKIIFCSGLYPQFAIPDELNYAKVEQAFHTKTKPYIFLHPFSYFGLHPKVLKLEDSEIVTPNTMIKYKGKSFSSKHQLLCYLNILETNKIYLTSMIRMPALQTLLFFSKTIDVSFNLSKVICDNWILLEILNPKQAEILIIKLIELRKNWDRIIDAKLSKKSEDYDLTMDVVNFFNTDVVYSVKRLLPYDLQESFTGETDFELKENPFDSDFEVKKNSVKGGFFVTSYLTYNSVLPNEREDCYESDIFECKNCTFTFNFNCLERLQHYSCCKSAKSVNERQKLVRKPNSIEFYCQICKKKYYFTSIEVLKHKKYCT